MSAGVVHGGLPAGAQQQMMWNEGGQQAYGGAPVGLAAWVDAHAFPVPPPPNENEEQDVEAPVVMRKVAALEVENCEMAGKMAGMEALLREREMEATEMKQTLLAYEHVLEGERRGEPLSKAELLKQVIALSAQLQELSKHKTAAAAAAGAGTSAAPGRGGPQEDGALAPLPPPPGSAPKAVTPEKALPGHGASPYMDPGEPPVENFEASPEGSVDEDLGAIKHPQMRGSGAVEPGYMAPPPVRLGAGQPPMQAGQPWGAPEAQPPPMQMARPASRGELRIPASPRAGGMMVPPSPRMGGPIVPASPRVSAAVNQYAPRVPQSPRIAYNRVPQSPRVGGASIVPQSPRVSMNPGYAAQGTTGYYQERPMTSPAPMVHRSASVGMTAPPPMYPSTNPLGHSASFGGGLAPPMTPSAASAYGGPAPSNAGGAFMGHNVPNMNAAEMYGGDITASGLGAVRGSLLTFQRAKNLQAKESVLRHLDSMVEHGRVSPDEVVAGVMEKCTERLRMVPALPRQSGGLLSNLAGKAKLKAAEDDFLKNAVVAEVGLLSSTVVAFEWAPSSSFMELLETVPDLFVRRLLTLEFLNGIFGRCGKLAVAKVINELSYLDTMVGDGLLPSVKELSNCMVLVMVNTKRSVEWRRKWVLGKA